MNSTLPENSTEIATAVPYYPEYYQEPYESKVVRYVINALLFLFAIVGNITVCLVPVRHRRMRTFTYYLITNLAVSDIFTMLCLPPLLVYEFQGSWNMGSVMCKLVNPALTMFGLVTTNTLVAIAIDRFIALVFPFTRRPERKETILVVSLSWLVAFASVLPSFGARTLVERAPAVVYCEEIFPGKTPEEKQVFAKGYSIFLYLLNNALPILIISCLYIIIILKLKGISLLSVFKRKSSNTEDGLMSRSSSAPITSDSVYEKQKHDREKKFTQMLLSVVVVFILCYVPVQTFFLTATLSPQVLNWKYTQIIYIYLYLMMWFPNALNPLLYGSMNDHYAKAFKILLRCTSKSRFNHSTFNHSCGPSYGHPNRVNNQTVFASVKDSSL
ncbi:neuropeptide Y receptor type 2 isoform X1 [Nematostella vectensis]|uniref:neuropeptide Y receptor type 2 isoform X1 n=1 Tax=Nematostella vectensis TaxID=45351 RepID=UPI0020778633|nr:neuropeptide Y receptor type 2 isoform X1 [Nematostella vectensis]XP_032235253.2 neuropeptide Y receptor type 2 isoform X1 [Nematostella vectensis]XP_032235254.2 neuropeptide Y receptor type 2 isoform X1 [Nematostella vectensis]XP_032235255.2 neuropeptide Y receptor type 2 isoform X1 [Nematostella vectensis]XP_032235256.2 neuropeptide Y receptor type 2 isoform X1 [Nematostella vectensis]XP_032235257.2 neuropeptide Y receptor type 2 isoform X1 [Nematostella vectensis]XP_032235258.2 neuropep